MTRWKDAAEKWVLSRFPEYNQDRSVMHVDVEVFQAGAAHGYQAGRAEALEEAAKLTEHEAKEYVKSMKEFDARGDVEMGTNEARCAVTAEYLAVEIRALLKPTNSEQISSSGKESAK